MPQNKLSFINYALLILLSAIWGASFLLIKISVETIPPITLTAIRLALAALVLIGVALAAGQVLPRQKWVWGGIFAMGLTGNVLPFSLISWGQQAIDAGTAAITMGVMPLATIVLAHIFTQDEKMSWRKAIGVVFGLAGLIVLIGPDKIWQGKGDIMHQLAVAGAAVSYGVNALIAKFYVNVPRRMLAAMIMVVSALVLIPAAFFIESPALIEPSNEALIALVILAVVQTALATLLMFSIISRAGASFFSQLNYLVPLFGVFWGVLILAERPGPNAFWALALILAGIAITREKTKQAPIA